MKQEIKEIKKEVIERKISYVAIDGTSFGSEEECIKYEESAVCVLKSRLAELKVAESDEFSLLSAGDEDTSVWAIRINSEADKNAVFQLYALEHSHLFKDENNAWVKRVKELINKAFNDKDILLIGFNYDNDMFIIDTRNTIVERLNNIENKTE